MSICSYSFLKKYFSPVKCHLGTPLLLPWVFCVGGISLWGYNAPFLFFWDVEEPLCSFSPIFMLPTSLMKLREEGTCHEKFLHVYLLFVCSWPWMIGGEYFSWLREVAAELRECSPLAKEKRFSLKLPILLLLCRKRGFYSMMLHYHPFNKIWKPANFLILAQALSHEVFSATNRSLSAKSLHVSVITYTRSNVL